MASKHPKKPKKQRRRMRLLPVTVTMLSLLLVIKVNELYMDSERLRDMYAVRDASAEEKAAAAAPADPAAAKAKADAAADALPNDGTTPGTALAPKPSDAKKDEKAAGDKAGHGEEAKKEESGHGEAKKEEAGHGEAKKEEGGHGEAKKEDDGHGGGSKKPEPEPRTFGTGRSTLKAIEELKAQGAETRYTKTELDLLENLSRRRDEIDAREKDLDMKSRVLDATEKRINDKIGEMKTLQTEMAKVLAQYNEKQDAQIKSLVKIYEGMKPDEAAAIFNELEMPILLDVVSRMSERKVALVLANMNPKRARDVTQELADRRKKVDMNASAIGTGAVPGATPGR